MVVCDLQHSLRDSEAEVFLERLSGDWDRASVKKPWLQKDAWVIHASSGGFLAIMTQLKESIPQKDYQAASPNLVDQFKLGIFDGDILDFLEKTVPPVSLQDVPFVRTGCGLKGRWYLSHVQLCFCFQTLVPLPPDTHDSRSMITNVEQQKLREAQKTERELQEKVNMATVEQMRHTFNKDMEILKGRVPNNQQVAKEAAPDKKYLTDRQKTLCCAHICFFFKKMFGDGGINSHHMIVLNALNCLLRQGQNFTKEFMDWKCKLIFPKNNDANAAGASFADTASFISKWQSKDDVSRVFFVKQLVCCSALKSFS